jgi:hypothetical protein
MSEVVDVPQITVVDKVTSGRTDSFVRSEEDKQKMNGGPEVRKAVSSEDISSRTLCSEMFYM